MTPRGARVGPWQSRYFCRGCGFSDFWLHNVSPCPQCGSRNGQDRTCRRVRFNWGYRLLAWAVGREQPADYWEFKE